MRGRALDARSTSSTTAPPTWRGFVVCVALPAAVLALLGIRAASLESHDRERQIAEQRSQTAFLADTALEAALERLEKDAGRRIETPPPSSIPFTLESNGVLLFPKDRVYSSPDVSFVPASRQIPLDETEQALIEGALAAESQNDSHTAKAAYRRVATASPGLRSWSSLALARLDSRKQSDGIVTWARTTASQAVDALSPTGFPVLLLAALQVQSGASAEAKTFLRQTLAELRKGRWWLRLEERKHHDATLQAGLADPMLPADLRLADLAATEEAVRKIEPFRVDRATRLYTGSLLILATRRDNSTVAGYALPPAALREFADRTLGPLRKQSSSPIALQDGAGSVIWGDDNSANSALPLRAIDHWRITMGSPTASQSSEARTLFWYGLVVLLVLVLSFGVTMTFRTAAREMELSRMQSAFAAGVTHEFKTPVTSIRLLMERISSGRAVSADTLRNYSDAVMRETRRLEDLINRLLEVHRIQSGHARYNLAPHCLYEIAACAAGNLQAQAAAKQIEIEVEADDPTIEIELDRTAVQDSIQNLVDNAIKYSPARTRVLVTIRHGADQASVSVCDQGIGIEVWERDRIFDRFYRGKRGAQQLATGTGLGLWLVKAVAEAHGGGVSVTSSPGNGSEFIFRISSQRQGVCRES